MSPSTKRSSTFHLPLGDCEVPTIEDHEPFVNIVTKLTLYISRAVDGAYTYDQLRTTFASQSLRPLITSLSNDCHHPATVAALLASRYVFSEIETDGSGINESRALACEFVAWQFLTFLSERELMEYLLYELPTVDKDEPSPPVRHTRGTPNGVGSRQPSTHDMDESAPLLQPRPTEYDGLVGPDRANLDDHNGPDPGNMGELEPNEGDYDLASTLAGMNALEIGLVCDAKKFISCKPVQKVVTDVWHGDIVYAYPDLQHQHQC
jgi:hypothetical protein